MADLLAGPTAVQLRVGQVHPEAARCTALYVDDDALTTVEDVSCAFCGERAHRWKSLVPPTMLRRLASVASRDGGGDVWAWLVPCCEECDGVLGHDPYRSPEAMREHVWDVLRRRNAEVIDMEDHDDLDEFGPGLRRYLEASLARRDVARERIAYRGPFPKGFGSPSLNMRLRNMLR